MDTSSAAFATAATASLGAPDAQGWRNWSANVPVPDGANAVPARYLYFVHAFDAADNRTELYHPVRVGPYDTTLPLVTITSPASGTTLSRLTQVAGTTADPDAADGLRVAALLRSRCACGGLRVE